MTISGPEKSAKKKSFLKKRTFCLLKRTFGPGNRLAKSDFSKTCSGEPFNAEVLVRILGYRGPCPPDRPWAFRRQTPPSVVYRGTLGKPGIPGFSAPGAIFVGNPGFPVLEPKSRPRSHFSSPEAKSEHFSGPRSGRIWTPNPLGFDPGIVISGPGLSDLAALRFPNNFWKN